MFSFTKPKINPSEQARNWIKSIRKEKRDVERNINNLNREKAKSEGLIKNYAKTNNLEACKLIAKEVVRTKKTISRLNVTLAQLGSLEMSIQSQLATIRMTGVISQSTEVARAMNSLINVKETQQVARELSKEMIKAGIVQEIIQETLDVDEPEIEAEADEECEKVILEVTKGILGEGKKAPTTIKETAVKQLQQEEEQDDEMEAMQERLSMLKQV